MPDYRQVAIQAAQRAGIDPNIFLRQIQQESGFNPGAVSPAGARGIAQFMPATAAGYHIDPMNPQQALNAAAHMDAANYKKYGNWKDVLSLYNSGRGWQQGQKIGETSHYVQSILAGQNPSSGSQGVRTAPVASQTAPGLDSKAATSALLLASVLQGKPINPGDILGIAMQRKQQQLAEEHFPNSPAKGSSPSVGPAPRGATDSYIEKFAAPYGLTVTSTTGGKHAEHSYHYQGRAVDFGGDPSRMATLAQNALKTGGWTELIYTGPGNPGYSILGGKVIPNTQLPKALYDEHTNHVHIAK